MIKRKVGLYLGTSSLGAAVTENKRIVSLTSLDLSSLEKEENVNENIRQGVLVNKILKELGAEEKEICLSLADKDFIVRSLEMPLMQRKEITTSMAYEIERYIPFKIDELRWDYHYQKFLREKKMNLSFIGIKKSSLSKTKEMLTHLGLKPLSFEPASLSLARILKSRKDLSGLKNFALLDITGQEANLNFFYHDLLLFNRYLPVPQKENGIDLEKFTDSVLLSFQYFNREFKEYKLDTFIVIGNSPTEVLASFIKDELQIRAEEFTPYDFTNEVKATVDALKALGAANRDYYPYSIKPVLLSLDEHLQGKALESIPLKAAMLASLAGLGMIISLFAQFYLGHKISVEKHKLERERESLPFVPQLKGLALGKIKKMIGDQEKKVNALKGLKTSAKKVFPFLEKLSLLLPQGLWLDHLDLQFAKDAYGGTLTGYIFLGDDYQERAEVDKLVANLRKEGKEEGIFSNARLVSSRPQGREGFTVTSFTVALE